MDGSVCLASACHGIASQPLRGNLDPPKTMRTFSSVFSKAV